MLALYGVYCYAVRHSCTEYAKNDFKLRKYSKRVTLFPARALLQFVAIDILEELVHSPQGHLYLLIITDRFLKLVRTIPLKRITASVVARAFFTH